MSNGGNVGLFGEALKIEREIGELRGYITRVRVSFWGVDKARILRMQSEVAPLLDKIRSIVNECESDARDARDVNDAASRYQKRVRRHAIGKLTKEEREVLGVSL